MKTLHLSIILFLFVLVHILSQSVFAQKTAHEILQERDDMPVTRLAYHGAVLIINQTLDKLEYKMGENIIVHPEMINIGNSSVVVANGTPLFDIQVIYQNGTKVFDSGYSGMLIVGWGFVLNSGMTEKDNGTWGWNPHATTPVIKLDIPGKYTILSESNISLYDTVEEYSHSGPAHPEESLWSKPIQVTVLPEKYTTTRLMIESAPTALELVPPQDRHIHLRFFNATTNNPIKDEVFAMNVTKGNQTLLQNTFWTQSGSFTLNLKPGPRYLWTANPDHDPMDGLYYSKGDQIDIDTSYLTEDTYHFSIIPISGYQVYMPIPHQQTGEKFETDLNLLSTYNKTIVPDIIPEFPFAVPILLISIVSVIAFYRVRFRK